MVIGPAGRREGKRAGRARGEQADGDGGEDGEGGGDGYRASPPGAGVRAQVQVVQRRQRPRRVHQPVHRPPAAVPEPDPQQAGRHHDQHGVQRQRAGGHRDRVVAGGERQHHRHPADVHVAVQHDRRDVHGQRADGEQGEVPVQRLPGPPRPPPRRRRRRRHHAATSVAVSSTKATTAGPGDQPQHPTLTPATPRVGKTGPLVSTSRAGRPSRPARVRPVAEHHGRGRGDVASRQERRRR